MTADWTYEERLKIPLKGDSSTIFKTPSGTTIAQGYRRIVIGARGPYIEFDHNHLIDIQIFMPPREVWRVRSDKAYYIEHRTIESNIKVYAQKKSVDYADYIPGYYYISPFDLRDTNNCTIIDPLKEKQDTPTTVVHCKRDKCDVLIDRRTKWGNPFAIGKDGDRGEVIEKYREWILRQPELLKDLHELKGKVLGCWCAPRACHGDVLVELISKLRGT